MKQDIGIDVISSIIEEYGVYVHHVVGIDEPLYAYTVGLFCVGHPEFIVLGLHRIVADGLLYDLSFAVLRAGVSFSVGDRVHRPIRNGFDRMATLISVDHPEDHLDVAYRVRDHRLPIGIGPEIGALQVVVADRLWRSPWMSGSENSGLALLGSPPALGTGADRIL
ncbi:DUF4262 domain-containing protein [Nocardia sp. NPDC004722]